MIARTGLKKKATPKSDNNDYFGSAKSHVKFIQSGSKLLDLALGGGWAETRIANIVGDKSSGKTLLCIEAAVNFIKKYPKGRVLYREAEAAFDQKYAAALGLPLRRVEFGDPDNNPFETIEDMYDDLMDVAKANEKRRTPILYIVDSLDALSDRAEMDRDIDQATYGANKARQQSQLFRRLVRRIHRANITVIIVSQVRSKIGVSFGRTTTRAGGRALDFYASQTVYIAQVGRVKRTSHGIDRTTGIDIHAMVDKNKIALPFREADFTISFGFGIDDLLACLQWLETAGYASEVVPPNYRKKLKSYARSIAGWSDEDYWTEVNRIHDLVEQRWYEVEKTFLPKRRKYG